MRERSTWNRDKIAKFAADQNKLAASPDDMRPEHLSEQPSSDEYLTGTPSSFAEDVAPPNWKIEQDGSGNTKRNEIGQPEMRPESMKSAADMDDEMLARKADLCVKVARQILVDASESLVEDQALSFMHLPHAELLHTANRLNGVVADDQQDDQDQDDDESEDQGQQQGQDKEAGKVPPQFLEQQQKMKDKAKAKSKGDDDEEEKKASTSKDAYTYAQEQAQAAAIALQSGNQAQAQAAIQGMIQSMIQTAMGDMGNQAYTYAEEAPQAMGDMDSEAYTYAEEEAPQVMDMEQDDLMLDQMLGEQGEDVMAADDSAQDTIQLEGAPMDVGEAVLAADDQVLSELFSSNQEYKNAAEAHAITGGGQAPAPSPAANHTARTASTRTVGTRPSGGVSQLGGNTGGGNVGGGTGDINKLSGLWRDAPDVSNHF